MARLRRVRCRRSKRSCIRRVSVEPCSLVSCRNMAWSTVRVRARARVRVWVRVSRVRVRLRLRVSY